MKSKFTRNFDGCQATSPLPKYQAFLDPLHSRSFGSACPANILTKIWQKNKSWVKFCQEKKFRSGKLETSALWALETKKRLTQTLNSCNENQQRCFFFFKILIYYTFLKGFSYTGNHRFNFRKLHLLTPQEKRSKKNKYIWIEETFHNVRESCKKKRNKRTRSKSMEAEEKKPVLKSCKLHPAKLDVALAQTVRPQKLRSFNFRPKFPLLSYQDIVKIKVLGKCLPNCFQLVGKKCYYKWS